MKNYLSFGLIIFLFLCSFSLTTAQQLPVVITSRWLKENLGNPDVVVLHVSNIRRDYDNGHIPGARFLWPGWISVSTPDETTVPANSEQIKLKLEELGVNGNSYIILCGAYGNIIPVCRVFVTLEHVGLEGRVSILDGGLEEWQETGGEITTASSKHERGKLILVLQKNLVDADWIAANMKNSDFCFIDVRAKTYYEGNTGTPRKGHIPGAFNLPSTDFYDGKTFRFYSPDKLMEMFGSLKIKEGVKPVFYCHSGNMASSGYVAARIAGFEPLLYDGSMEDWGSRFDLPLEK